MQLLPRSPMARDAVVAGIVTLLAQVELLLLAEDVSGPNVWHHLADLLIFPALLLRRRAPLAATLVAAAGLAFDPLLGPAPAATPYLVLLVVLASLGWYASLGRGLVGLGATLACGLLYDVTTDDFRFGDLVVNVVILVAVWAAGHGLRAATDRMVAAEVEKDRAARDAVELERARIARDMHDSLAHALTLMTLQAGGARERVDQGIAAEALGSIEKAGREALDDMHRVLGLLAQNTDADAPGIAHLDDLAEGVRGSGIDVMLDVGALDVPPSVSTTVYRVVQESLTNVVRHSEARAAEVVVRCEGDVLVTVVTGTGSPRPPRTRGTGRGLGGLRQRLAMFGGSLESSATRDGWRVEARIPLASGHA